MDERERKRLEYKPELSISRTINTKHVETVAPETVDINDNTYTEPVVVNLPTYRTDGYSSDKASKANNRSAINSYKVADNSDSKSGADTSATGTASTTQQDSLTQAVLAYSRYNPGESLKDCYDVADKLTQLEKLLHSKLNQDSTYSNYADAINDGDFSSIDKYRYMAENIDGDIIPEIYPMVYDTLQDVNKLINTINNSEFDGTADVGNIDDIIANEDNKRNAVIDAERTGKPVDYKTISIAAQMAKFFEDRVSLLNRVTEDIVEPVGKIPFALPNNSDLIKDYYDEVMKQYNEDQVKMQQFNSSNVVYEIIDEINKIRPKIKRNRTLLAEADDGEFFSILPIAKIIEQRYKSLIVDLYKAELTDEMYKGDYIGSLKLKNAVRSCYSS